ncbi:putative Eukaryotic translation initiation factor 2-alpha kinase 3 [Trypanosoma cruzi]|nr:putative Eukaryotic translation initiation factor 2-alpha kinase 3 [Trypanosoma cruzi]
MLLTNMFFFLPYVLLFFIFFHLSALWIFVSMHDPTTFMLSVLSMCREEDFGCSCEVMEGGTAQSAVMFLLLLLLDGRICCVSLVDGKVRWETQLPGGPLFHCGPRRQSKKEKRMWAHLPFRSACRSCRSISTRTMGTEAQQEKELENGITDCSLLFFPHDGTKHRVPFMNWHLLVAPNRGDKKVTWWPVNDVIKCWNESSCSAHKVLELQQQVTSHTELDFSSGKLLISLSSQEDHINTEEETVPDEVSSVRIILERTDQTRNVIFPPSQPPSHSRVETSSNREGQEEVSQSWYATHSTVTIDLLETSLDDGLFFDSGSHVNHRFFHIVQTITGNGFTSCLHISEGSESIGRLQLADVNCPLVAAQIVCRKADAMASNEGKTSRLTCQGIPVVTSWSKMERIYVFNWNLQECGGNVQELSGFLYGNRRVLFVESVTPKIEFLPVPCDSETPEKRGVDFLPSCTLVGNGYGNGSYIEDDDDSSETESSVSSGAAENAMVLHKRVTSLRNGEEKGALVSGDTEISFFDENFEIVALLGRGASGAALLTRNRLTGLFYAVKVMLMRDYFSKDNALREVRLHALLHHRYLVRYYACWSEALTPCRIQQLATIGLCKPMGLQEKAVINGPGCIDCVDQQHGVLLQLKDSTTCLLASEQQAMNRNLLMAPPDTKAGNSTGTYLAGVDSPESSLDGSPQRREEWDDGEESDSSSSVSSNASGNPPMDQVVFLQLEYCQTTLAHRLGSRICIDRVENIIIALQIFSALHYIHSRDCLHRDVKPTNVFLDYHCQTIGMDDTSDDVDEVDEDDEDDDINNNNNNDDDDASAGDQKEEGGKDDAAENTTNPNGGVHDFHVDSDENARSRMELVQPDLAPAIPTQFLSAFELLRLKASVGLLALYLKRFKSAQDGSEKRKVARLVRRWLISRLVQVRLGDLGLAKPLSDQRVEVARYFDRSAINTLGVGSPLYSSPEQLEGALCTPASDAFSAGVLLAEMYIEPKTVSERLFELQRVRDGVFPYPALLREYPELQVVQGLTRSDPKSRMTLRDAGRVLVKTLDKILILFLSS